MSIRTLTASLACLLIISSCAPAASPAPSSDGTDLSGIKTYLLEKASALEDSAAGLQAAADQYYDLAMAANFDYDAIAEEPAEAASLLADAKNYWLQASPTYEQMEGIVAGVPTLSSFDVILDAGASGSEDPENAAPYDLTLPDGRVIERPGNVFGVLESALWGSEPAFTGAAADLDANGTLDFGESLPDANLLKAAAAALVTYSQELETAAAAWAPDESDAFTILVVMIPTMNEYFNSWKSSRFVSGDASSQRDFVAISRLSDIQDILGGLQVVYQGVRPLVESINLEQAGQIDQSLSGLKTFIANIHAQEQNGKHFSAEDADILGAEAQNQATALAGKISQVAAQLGITIDN